VYALLFHLFMEQKIYFVFPFQMGNKIASPEIAVKLAVLLEFPNNTKPCHHLRDDFEQATRSSYILIFIPKFFNHMVRTILLDLV